MITTYCYHVLLQKVGEILHMAGSGRVIIELSTELVEEGSVLCDQKGAKVAKVNEMIGPVKRPFASAIPLTNNIKKYVGQNVFMLEVATANKMKNNRRKKS